MAVAEPRTEQKNVSPAPGPKTFTEVVTLQIEALEQHHRAVLESDDVEAVHKMRVTTRRLQASIDLLQWGANERRARKLKRLLRRWRRSLSRVRNYDVFIGLLEKQTTVRRRKQPVRNELLEGILRERRQRRLTKALTVLNKVDLDHIYSELGLSRSTPDAATVASGVSREAAATGVAETTSAAPPHGSSVTRIPMSLEKQLIENRAAERIEQRVGEFLALAARTGTLSDPTQIHQLRIAAKRLRYLFELVSEMGYGEAVSSLKWLKTLQDRIGDWHDLESLSNEIVAIVSRRNFIQDDLAAACEMLQLALVLEKKKIAMVEKTLPMVVPARIGSTARRLARSLRRPGRSARRTRPRPDLPSTPVG